MIKWYGRSTGNDLVLPKIVPEMPHSKDAEYFYNSLPTDLKITSFLKSVSEHYIAIINKIITDNISIDEKDQYDEVLYFQLNKENMDLINYPFFTLQGRNEEEGFEYMKDANRILKMFKNLYYWKIDKNIFNKPILLENAPGTEFDILIVLDIWYMVFLNKKHAEVLIEELNMYEKEILDMIYCIRTKVMSLS